MTKLEKMRRALEDIADPLKALRKQAKREGGTLNGLWAIQLSNDPNWLKEKARKALE